MLRRHGRLRPWPGHAPQLGLHIKGGLLRSPTVAHCNARHPPAAERRGQNMSSCSRWPCWVEEHLVLVEEHSAQRAAAEQCPSRVSTRQQLGGRR